MLKEKNMLRVIISLFIGLYALNIGIGMSNSSYRQNMDCYNGNPNKQIGIKFANPNDNIVTPENFIIDVGKEVEENSLFVRGKQLNEFGLVSSAYFINDKFYSKPMIKDGSFFNKEDVMRGNKVVIGEEVYKKKFGSEEFQPGREIELRGNKFEVIGIAYSMFKGTQSDYVSTSYYFSIKDFDKIYPKEIKAMTPMYLEFVIEGNTIGKKEGDKIINKIHEIFGSNYHETGYVSFLEEFKKVIHPSPKIIASFSIFILLFTILTIWAVTSLLIQENYKNFAVMKALGANENIIAIDFLKSFVIKYFIVGIIAYISFRLTCRLLIESFDFKLYPMINNIIYTLISTIVVSAISFIKPFLEIKKLKLVEYLKAN